MSKIRVQILSKRITEWDFLGQGARCSKGQAHRTSEGIEDTELLGERTVPFWFSFTPSDHIRETLSPRAPTPSDRAALPLLTESRSTPAGSMHSLPGLQSPLRHTPTPEPQARERASLWLSVFICAAGTITVPASQSHRED